jgi:hypothetical protein
MARGSGGHGVKRAVFLGAAAGLLLLPAIGHTQTLQFPGLYLSVEGGVNWMFNTTINNPTFGAVDNLYPNRAG